MSVIITRTSLSSSEAEDRQSEKPNIKGDRLNFALLTILYLLQAAVLGTTVAIPFVLQKRNVTYKDQAEFNIVMYSFSFKILWAPIVDSVYFKKMGRRKSWLVPTQYCIGILLLLISMNVENWLGTEDGTKKPNVRLLTVIFFLCIFLTSTQDIAVDGWSLTIFQRKNIGYSAHCQSIGFALGFFLAFIGFITLDSKDFCNLFRSVPQDHGLVNFSDFILFWSIVFIVITTFILIFKKENNVQLKKSSGHNERELSIKETYRHLWKILKIRSIRRIALFLFTWHVAFGPMRNVAPLKLLDVGIHRDIMALLTVPSLPLQLVLPFLLSRFLVGPRPMRIFLLFYVLKLINCVVYALLIFAISYSKYENKIMPTWYYWPLVFIYNFENMTGFIMMLSLTSLYARISDPQFGGVYLTLLNSLNNVGHHWPSTTCLWLVDFLTIKSCKTSKLQRAKTCHTIIDGFYVEIMTCVLIGTLWIFWGKRQIYSLEKMDTDACIVKQKASIIKNQLLLSNVNTCNNNTNNNNNNNQKLNVSN